jgi:hypothetical protein
LKVRLRLTKIRLRLTKVKLRLTKIRLRHTKVRLSLSWCVSFKLLRLGEVRLSSDS